MTVFHSKIKTKEVAAQRAREAEQTESQDCVHLFDCILIRQCDVGVLLEVDRKETDGDNHMVENQFLWAN